MDLPFRDPQLIAFFKYLEIEKNFSLNTRKAYFFDIVNFLIETWGENSLEANKIQWASIDREKALSYVFQLQEKNITKNTLLRKCSALRSLYNYFQREGFQSSTISRY